MTINFQGTEHAVKIPNNKKHGYIVHAYRDINSLQWRAKAGDGVNDGVIFSGHHKRKWDAIEQVRSGLMTAYRQEAKAMQF
jgi:hypothetical protein